jgi:hypothetical protein
MVVNISERSTALFPASRWDLRLGARLLQLEERYGLFTTAFALALAVELASYCLNARVIIEYHSWSRLLWPSEDPLGVIPAALADHRHRILGALIAYAAHLRGIHAVVVPIAANLAVHTTGYVWLRREGLRPEHALGVVALVATTLVIAANRMVIGFQDSLAALGLLLALGTGSPWRAALVLGVFMFADERIVTAVPLLIFWQVHERPWPELRREVLVRGFAFGLAAVVALYLMHWIRQEAGVADASADHLRRTFEFQMLKYNSNAVAIGYFMALRGAWLLPAVATALLWRSARRDAVLFGLALLATLPAAALVGDISRVAAFCAVPSVYMGAVIIQRHAHWSFRQLLLLALLINLLCPCLHMVGDDFVTGYPLPLQLFRNYVQTGQMRFIVFE